jgi:hypothetical protein
MIVNCIQETIKKKAGLNRFFNPTEEEFPEKQLMYLPGTMSSQFVMTSG